MEAGLGDVVTAGEEAVVQLLHVQQLGLEVETAQIDPPLEDGVERERVVRARGEPQPQPHRTASATSPDAARSASRSRHRDRSRSPARFENPRTIVRWTPWRSAATATA